MSHKVNKNNKYTEQLDPVLLRWLLIHLIFQPSSRNTANRESTVNTATEKRTYRHDLSDTDSLLICCPFSFALLNTVLHIGYQTIHMSKESDSCFSKTTPQKFFTSPW